MARILIRLNRDRNKCGELTVVDDHDQPICGPVAVAARASDRLAREHGNETRNPLLRHGDTPIGSYRVSGILKSGRGTPYNSRQYGPNGLVVMDGVSEDAALAEANGRFHIFIQGGATSRGGKLRSTNGCLRLFDADQKKLIERIRTLGPISCECIEDARAEGKRTVLVDDSYDEGDPPALLEESPALEPLMGREFTRRSMIAASAAAVGSIALSGLWFGGDGEVKWVELGPPPAVAQDYGTPPQGPAGLEGPANQPFGVPESVPPNKAGLSPETNQPGGSETNPLKQLPSTEKSSTGAAGAQSPEQQKEEGGEGFTIPPQEAPAVSVPTLSGAEPPTPQDTSDPQYQQLKGDYDKSKQEYQHAVQEENKASSDWDKARRDPNSVTKEEYNAAYQRAQQAESARQAAQYQAQQKKQQVTTYVLDKSKKSGQ